MRYSYMTAYLKFTFYLASFLVVFFYIYSINITLVRDCYLKHIEIIMYILAVIATNFNACFKHV